MTVTIQTLNFQETEQLLRLLKTLDIKNIQIDTPETKKLPTITSGDKTIDPKALFGIWKNKPRNIEEIRTSGWKRKAL